MKLIVETTGPFRLKDPVTDGEIDNARPCVVIRRACIQARISIGQRNVLERELKGDATDDEFAKYWKESDRKRSLAMDSFLSKFGKDAGDEPESEPVPAAEPEVKEVRKVNKRTK